MTTRFRPYALLTLLLGSGACTADTSPTGLRCGEGSACLVGPGDGAVLPVPGLPPGSSPFDASVASPGDGAVGGGASAVGDLPCDVAALVTRHCASCHGATPQFGAPMALAARSDFLASARGAGGRVADAVLARVKDDQRPMPPAPHARVDGAGVAALEAWVAAGLPAGAGRCAANDSDGGGVGTGGSVVPKPADCASTYELKAHGASLDAPFAIAKSPVNEGNQYHCFYFDPPYAAGSGMLWFEPILDNTKNLHHWILYATDRKTHASGTSAACNAAEPGAYFVAGWAPGANNVVVPSDTSLELPSGPGAGLILELHYYNDTGAPANDQSGLRFCTAPQTSRAHVAAVHSTGSEGICVNPGEAKDVVGTCGPRTDMGDIHILGVWPHMHKIARHQKLVVKRANGTSEVIHDAPFDFNAQIFYPKDVTLKPGDKLETHCSYRNDTGRQVTYGENTQEEMCYSFVMAWPAGALANPPSAFDVSSASYPLNRCANNASILQACGGLNDAPVTVQNYSRDRLR